MDPYPKKLLLSQREVQNLLSMDRTTWYEFLQDPTTGFPRAVILGQTKSGKPRLRWKKWQVLLWHEGLAHVEGDAPATDGRKKS